MFDREFAIRLAIIVGVFALFGNLVPRSAPVCVPGGASGVPGLAAAPLPGQPAPEPLVFEALPADKARAINAAIAFAADKGPPARPFVFTGDAPARERATDCLAAAMLYEAGDDDRGQRAVAQVVLNRARHPAFPANVCGVVFQGSERATGCQFTFTCDGAMQRSPSPEAWTRARARAGEMLNGAVAAEVGLATHYHTDWVHPVWSARMDKIAQVETHLFFRWHGNWGTAAVMRGAAGGSEPVLAGMAALSPAHREALPPDGASEAALAAGDSSTLAPPAPELAVTPYAYDGADAALLAAAAGPHAAKKGTFVLDMAPGGNGVVQALKVLDTCGTLEACKVFGRLNGSAPDALRRRVAFVYLRDRRTGMQRSYWNCDIYHRTVASQCLGPGNRQWLAWEAPATIAPASAATTGGAANAR
ncbi:MAG: cell wall hydrolase [Sphingomonadales bacterium]|nr:cell wall hydrolase [Sphingomonadales bacterium]